MNEIEVMDLAIIFTPFINEQNVLNYKATEVVEGYYEDNDDKFIDTNFMETLTYHALGLGFVALSLKSGVK